MCLSTITLCIDPTLGRVDYNSLSDQTLMEMLIDGFDDKTKAEYQDNDGMYLDVCKWSCIQCDDDERVIIADIKTRNVSGSIGICYVPPKVKELYMRARHKGKLTGSVDLTHLPVGMHVLQLQKNELTGEVDLAHLPNGMGFLHLNNNQLTGEIRLDHLPGEMQYLYLHTNKLTGELDLTQLPHRMRYLFLQNNNFTGEIDLTQLPDRILFLYLNNNQFTGEIDLTQLPHGINGLYLQDNLLSGSFIVKTLPPGMRVLNAQGNQFNAIAVIDSRAVSHILLSGSGVTSVVDENGNEVDSKRFFT